MAHATIVPRVYGIMAEFDSPEALIEAARQTRLEGYRRFDCYTPFPIHGLTDAMGVREAKVPWTVFICGLFCVCRNSPAPASTAFSCASSRATRGLTHSAPATFCSV